MGGFQDTWEASQWSHDSVVQAVGTCASGPNESCAYLYLMPNAEGPFFFFQYRTKNHSVCPLAPPFFFRIKIHVLWLPVHSWPCLYSSTRYRCWEHLELSNTTGERSRNCWWVGFGFSVSRGCQAVCRHRPRNGCLPGGIPCLLPKPVRLRWELCQSLSTSGI